MRMSRRMLACGLPLLALIGAAPSPAVVQVVVSLNERSEIVATRIQSSPDPAFNGPALASVRASKFRTEIRNCKPIAADYIFTVTFGE